MCLRLPLRLIGSRYFVQCHTLPNESFSSNVITAVHHFEESIGGRAYLIEVGFVAKDRWRACIVRTPGVPTALMPFYGCTPEEAARHLTAWLTRAYQPASKGAGSV